MRLTGLFLYPVKSLGGCTVSAVSIDALGPVGDRRFLVIDENGRFLTQRTLPSMALIATALTPTTLTLSRRDAGSITVPRASDSTAPLRSVSVWSSENLLAEDCGQGAAAWLSDLLRCRCRLVRIGGKFSRPMLKPSAKPGDVVSFPDSHPFLVASEASLADLNDRLIARREEPLPMNRFRPNLVVDGCPAFAEDTWTRIRIGDIVFRAGGPCVRCVVTTTDQVTAERGKEPLRTLATYRRDQADGSAVLFGQNVIHETKSGTLTLGDRVEIIG